MKKSKDELLFEKNKKLYKLEKVQYTSGYKLEVWRKNPKGFYNVVCYINSDDEFEDAVINDIKQQKATKSKIIDISDDDI